MTAHAIQNVRTRNEWAEIINADWRKSIEGIIQTGRDLIAAKEELPYGDFGRMIKTGCPFSVSMARSLMAISLRYDNWVTTIGVRHHDGELPSSWTTLAKLTSLSDFDFKDAYQRGLITAEISREKAIAISRSYKTPAGEAIGDGNSPVSLPSPKEAREVARATNRMVAASDGNLYSGATEEEGAEYTRRRDQTYLVIDTINAIFEGGVSAKQWCEETEDRWLNRFEFGRIICMITWLTDLRAEFIRQRLVFDCEVEADAE